MATTPEGKLLKQVADYLTKRGVFWIRINTQGQYDAKRGMYHPSPYTLRGTPDLLACPAGHAVFLELKAPKGRLSSDQVVMGEIIKDAGCEWYCIRSLQEVIDTGL